MTTRADIVTEARSWIGTRWQHQASIKGVGCDCIGLLVGVARRLGIDAAAAFDACAEVKGYGREPDPVMLERTCADLLLPCAAPGSGDILLMRFGSAPQHFGLITEPGYVVHAYAQARRVVEHRLDALWLSRVVRGYSFRGVD